MYRYSTKSPTESLPGLVALTVVSNQTACVFRSNSTEAWIVNPSAASETEFKIGTIDLSAYATGGNPPCPIQCIADGTLAYLLLARPNGGAFDTPGQIVIFDISDPTDPTLVGDYTLQVITPKTWRCVARACTWPP